MNIKACYNILSDRKKLRILIEILFFYTLIILLTFFSTVLSVNGSDIFVYSNQTSNFSAVDSHIDSFLKKMNINGASLIVKDTQGNVIWQKNYGSGFDENTVVPIASATKWMTGATIMTLVEEGLIQSLDDPVSKYLRYFNNKSEKSSMTIRQMLAFTTGLPEHHPIQDNPNITQQQECAYIAQNVSLLRSPGTGFEYGGLQEEIAACIAEVVTGKPFSTIIQEKLFDPLEMKDTKIANLVNRNPHNPDFVSANPLTSGGIYSSAADIIKFSQMILSGGVYNGKRIISEETIKAMKADQTFGVPIYRTIWTGDAAIQWRYGLGNWVQVLNPKDNSFEEESKRIISSEGAFGTSKWVDFDLNYAASFTVWAKTGEYTTSFVNDLKNLVSDAVSLTFQGYSISEPYISENTGFAVEKEYVMLTDINRNRDIKIKIFNPETEGNNTGLILLSHGFGETYDAYDYLCEYLAKSGYIVVAINHPDRDRAIYEKGGILTLSNPQLFDSGPKDISFVLDNIISGKISSISGKADINRIGVAGHSFGSTNSLQMSGLTLDSPEGKGISYMDSRIIATVAMSPQVGNAGEPNSESHYGIHDNSWNTVDKPAFLIWGSKDYGLGSTSDDPNSRYIAYQSIPGANTFKAVIEGAEHHAFTQSDPWYKAGERDIRHHEWIQQMVTAFFDSYLLGNEKALNWLKNNKMQSLTNGEVQQENKKNNNINSINTFTLYDSDRKKNLQMRITFSNKTGVLPLVIFSHFSGGAKDSMLSLQEKWASEGYVVISPDHSDSPNVGGKRGVYDLGDRAEDISFIINSINTIQENNPCLKGKINSENIGVAGHYLGSNTANLLGGANFGTFGTIYKDNRVDAILLMSPTGTGEGFTESSWTEVIIPMMVLTGSEDVSNRTDNSPFWRTEPYLFSNPGDKHLIFIHGLDASYGGLSTNTVKNQNIINYIELVTTNFLNSYLYDNQSAESFLKSDELEKITGKTIDVSWK